jgi:hypothetical protein
MRWSGVPEVAAALAGAGRAQCPDRETIIAVAERAKILPERLYVRLADKRRPADEKGDAAAFWRLRAGSERPYHRGATKKSDNLAPSHSDALGRVRRTQTLPQLLTTNGHPRNAPWLVGAPQTRKLPGMPPGWGA